MTTGTPDSRSENADPDINIIAQKLDFLVDLVHNHGFDGNDHRGKDMSELKTLIGDIDMKISSKGAPQNEDINFTHGITFMLLGVFLGVGISFAIINYQKIAKTRKMKLLD